MFDRHARDGFVRFAVPKVLVFGKPSSRRLIGRHNTFAEDGQAEVSRYEHENKRAFGGVRLKIFHHWQDTDSAVFFREVAAVGVGVYNDCLVRVAGAFKDCVERFRFCVVVDIADKAQRCGFLFFAAARTFLPFVSFTQSMGTPRYPKIKLRTCPSTIASDISSQMQIMPFMPDSFAAQNESSVLTKDVLTGPR